MFEYRSVSELQSFPPLHACGDFARVCCDRKVKIQIASSSYAWIVSSYNIISRLNKFIPWHHYPILSLLLYNNQENLATPAIWIIWFLQQSGFRASPVKPGYYTQNYCSAGGIAMPKLCQTKMTLSPYPPPPWARTCYDAKPGIEVTTPSLISKYQNTLGTSIEFLKYSRFYQLCTF